MEIPDMIQLAGEGFGLSVRMRLLAEANGEVVKSILSILPAKTFLLHVVVAGETVYLPIPTVAMATNNMVERRLGTVYYNTTSQSICLCYGQVTESTPVNQFAEVVEEDIPKLKELGKLVYQQTIASKVPRIVQMTLRRLDSTNAPRSLPPAELTSISGWRQVKTAIDRESAELRLPKEPHEVKMIRLGATQTLSGGEKSSLQAKVLLQGFLATLGPHILSRLLTCAADPDMTLSLIIRQTRVFLIGTFNQFEFLADLGLGRMSRLGRMYDGALDQLESMADYVDLTDSMRTLIQLFYRWLHLVFPWYIKDQFPGRTEEEAELLPSLSVYTEED